MFQVTYSKQFKKDYKRFQHDQKLLDEIDALIDLLLSDIPLPEKYRDHSLKGSKTGLRDCHVRPDVVLLYAKDRQVLLLTLHRVGSHAHLGL